MATIPVSPQPSVESAGSNGGSSPSKIPPAKRSEVSLRYNPTEDMVNEGFKRNPNQPWINSQGEVIWSPLRIRVYKVVDSHWFEMVMSAVIIFNLGLIVFQTDLEAQCYPKYAGQLEECPHSDGRSAPWIGAANMILLILYTVEASARLYVLRTRYLRNRWNALDCLIVTTGWASQVLGLVVNASVLRVFRVLRLVRALRVLIAFRELYLLIASFMSTLKTLLWGTAMMFGMLLMWGILMVEFVHPTNCQINFAGCERCSRGYRSVMSSVLTLYQNIVAGDSWGLINVPLIEEEPWTALFLVTATVSVSLGLTNLILAVIVERANEARDKDLEQKLKVKEQDQEKHKLELYDMCSRMDIDQSGTLTLSELMTSYDEEEKFRRLFELMDIRRDELGAVFKVLDKDGSGEIDYREFCEQLHQIRTRDPRTMLTFLKVSLTELKEEMHTLIEISGGAPKRQSDMISEGADVPATLARHEVLLLSIDERLEKLCRGGLRSSGGAAGPVGSKALRPLQPVAPPQPPPDTRPLRAEDVLGSLQGLGISTQELAGLQGGIARRLEEQVATLTRQAGTLASMRASFERAGNAAGFAFPDSQLGRASEKFIRLQENMQYELNESFKEIDIRLEDGAATLARNSELLTSLRTDLGCNPPNREGTTTKLVYPGAESKADDRAVMRSELYSFGARPLFDCSSISKGGPPELSGPSHSRV